MESFEKKKKAAHSSKKFKDTAYMKYPMHS